MRRIASLLFPLTLVFGAAPPAAADDAALAAAGNSLGLLEYCAEAGHVPASAAARQRQMFERLTANGSSRQVQSAYAKGKQGIVFAMGIEQALRDAARAQNLDEAGLCRQRVAMAGG